MALRSKRRFAFENYGGAYQLRVRGAEDLAALEELDEPFWIATSGPVDQFTCDPALLKRLDRDQSGRVQSCELREAVRWLLQILSSTEDITARSDVLRLEHLDRSRPEGQRLYDTGKQILQNLGQADSTTLSLTQVRNRKAIFSQGLQNGDGIIPPDSMDDKSLKQFIEDVMATEGSVRDLNGSAGVNQELLDSFLAHAKALLAWQAESQKDAPGDSLLPFGSDTAERYERYRTLSETIEMYFQQCRVVALNEILGRTAPDAPCPPETFAGESQATDYLAQAPLGRPRAEGQLPLKEGVNPFYEQALADLAETVLAPLLGEGFSGTALSEDEWDTVKQAFGPYERWLASKSGGQVETLGLDTLAAYVEGELPERLRTLIEADLAAGRELEALEDLEFVILLQRWIIDLCNNFVSFHYLHHPGQRAMVETGRLIMDGRIFNLNLKVGDVATHSAAAGRSGLYLLYSEVSGGTDTQTFYVVTPVTRGPIGTLGLGKRGVLFDTKGREWDTRVVRVIENPVSLREAIAAPFKRISALISSTVERISSGAEQQLQTQVSQTTTALEAGIQKGMVTPGATPEPAAPPVQGTSGAGRMRDLILAGGVAVAALGWSFASIAAKFSEMNAWHVLITLAVGLTIVIIPTVVLAVLKLRRQNLSAVLEASGWAINAPMRLTRGLRRLIVQQPPHPRSFRRLRKDLIHGFVRAVRRNRRHGE